MKAFLDSIATQYVARYSAVELSKFCFVFPGRRSAAFFQKFLKKEYDDVMVAPRMCTIAEFMTELSDTIPDNRIDLLFVLFNSYCELCRKQGRSPQDFEHFRLWGETVLSDFNDIDNHLVDANMLYQNLADYKSISTDYLTDEQKDVMEKYFGITDSEESVAGFWNNYSKSIENGKSDVISKFSSLWEILAPLYKIFNSKLKSENLSYAGAAARIAFNRLKEEGINILSDAKYVFVGFNVLTTVEWKTFNELKKLKCKLEDRESEPLADFIWDCVGIPMNDEYNLAARFVKKDMEFFPMPKWFEVSQSNGIPQKINVISSPSGAFQAKIVGEYLTRLSGENINTEIQDAQVAVVLPDENLLFPMLRSIPDSIGNVNLTMGCPLKYTPSISFVKILRSLQLRSDYSESGGTFYFEDVEAILGHPFAALLIGIEDLSLLKEELGKLRLTSVNLNFFENVELAKMLFYPLRDDATQSDVISYIKTIFAKISDNLESDEGVMLPKALTMSNINSYLRALDQLANACEKRNISLNKRDTFILADRLIAGEKILFEGKPLEGLQIMGVLETRSLDFKHLIIPSMNERIFPKRLRNKTFIPASLSKGFGLPTIAAQEAIFAYYFYRMICRAESVTMIYDARTAGMKSGEPSRYILQLKHLYAKDVVKTVDYSFNLSNNELPIIKVKKADVVSKLDKYLSSSNKNYLSPSSLNRYFACPLQFYYQYILGIKVEEDVTEFMSSVDIGNVVHYAMMYLYTGNAEPCLLTKPQPLNLDAITNEMISEAVAMAISKEYVVTGEAKLQAAVIEKVVRRVVELDKQFNSVEILGCEAEVKCDFPIDENRSVAVKFIIDRIDKVIEKNGETYYRIVDYKTGNVKASTDGFYKIFTASSDVKYLFQLLFYANFALKNANKLNLPIGQKHIRTVLYDIVENKIVTPDIDKVKILDVSEQITLHDGSVLIPNDAFEEMLKYKLCELFSAEGEFVQTDNLDNCKYCNFKNICRR